MVLAWLRRLHAWAGLALCLLVAAISVSGSVLAYKPAIVRATVAGAAAAPDRSPASLARAMVAAEAAFGPTVTSVTFASDEAGLHQVYLKGGGGGYLDQSGAVVQRWGDRERTLDWLFELHRGLLADATGDLVVGWIGVALVAMTVSGLVLWWPARRSFGAQVAPGRRRGGWLRAHRDLGVMTAPFIVVLALSGAALNLPDLFRPLMGATAAKAPKPSGAEGRVDWRRAMATAARAYPDGVIRMGVEPAKGGAASVRLQQPGEWHVNGRTVLYFDPADTALLGVSDSRKQPAGARAYNAFWPIHAAKVGGPVWRFLVCLSGIALAALSLYGAEAYRRKLFVRRQPSPAEDPDGRMRGARAGLSG
jgi:uncharacterized iron-regulated membrane protein